MNIQTRYERELAAVLKQGAWLLSESGRALPPGAWEVAFNRYQADLTYLRRLAEEVRPESVLMRLDPLPPVACPWELSAPGDPETGVRNEPTPEGRELGQHLARMTEAARRPGDPALCVDCAFRAGSEPNGCPATLGDALKCLLEGGVFLCHYGEENLCAGFEIAARALGEKDREPERTP